MNFTWVFVRRGLFFVFVFSAFPDGCATRQVSPWRVSFMLCMDDASQHKRECKMKREVPRAEIDFFCLLSRSLCFHTYRYMHTKSTVICGRLASLLRGSKSRVVKNRRRRGQLYDRTGSLRE